MATRTYPPSPAYIHKEDGWAIYAINNRGIPERVFTTGTRSNALWWISQRGYSFIPLADVCKVSAARLKETLDAENNDND